MFTSQVQGESMTSWKQMQEVVYDDRKRLRESVREMSASPKKGKHGGRDASDAFSFPAFAAPLDEIAQQCHTSDPGEEKQGGFCPVAVGHAAPGICNLCQGPEWSAVAQGTPEPQGSLSFEKIHDGHGLSITPTLEMAGNAASMHVQTLHAQAMPLSPFEWGDIPDVQSSDENAPTPTSVVHPTAMDGTAAVAGDTSLSQPKKLADNDTIHQDPCNEDVQHKSSLIQDVSIQSQNASQSSSLAETKILRSSNRFQSRKLSDESRESFKFSKAFTFQGLLGNTKTSTVYFAQAADGLFAIKEMKRPFSSKADRADMMRELRAVYALPGHANVVDYVRFWQEGRKLHIQMELCKGGSLDMLLKRSEICQDEKLPEDLLWLILSDAVHGLRHIHTHGVLHMDIKPENLFLDAFGTFKVGDFGLAINLCNQSGWEEGDGRYVAPELLRRSQPPSGAADIYSLGAAMLHCAIGTSLPVERTPQLVRRHLASHGYSVELQHIVACMIATSPQDRPSAEMICNLLYHKNAPKSFPSIRSKLAEVAATVHSKRVGQQRALHCSPSFSLSQSVDNATPGSIGQPVARPERAWSQLFSVKSKCGSRGTGLGRSPGSAAPVERAPVPLAPSVRTLLDRAPAPVASVGPAGWHPQPPKVGTPPSVVPKLHQHQKRHHRSPSAGSFDRCGALSYSSNGQASGSLNLEMYPDLSMAPGQADASTSIRGQLGSRADNLNLQHRQSTLRPESYRPQTHANRSRMHTVQSTGPPRKPLALIVPDGRDPVQPSPRSDVLHRYFSSQVQHEDILKTQLPLPNVSTAALSQVEVTGPCEPTTQSATTVRKTRQRRSAAPRPPELHELKDCLISGKRSSERPSATSRAASKTKGRAMVWKSLQHMARGPSSSSKGIASIAHEAEGLAEKHAMQTPLKFGHGATRRSRGTKIAGMAMGITAKDQENDGAAANATVSQPSSAVTGAGRQRDGLQPFARPANQQYHSKLRAVKTLHVSKAREMSTEVLASSRPELKQPLAVCYAHNRGI